MPDKDELTKGQSSKAGPRVQRPSYLRGSIAPKAANPSRPEAVSAAQPGHERPEVQRPEAQKAEEKEDVELYSWSVWLLPRRPLVSVLVVASLIGSILLAYWTLPQVFFVVIISLILINRLAPYLFPVKYVMTEETVGYRTFLAKDIRPWGNLLTYYQFPDGVLLTHDTRTIRGRMKEGIFLYYEKDGSNKEQVLNIVRSKLKPPKEAFAPREDNEYKGGIRSAWRRIRNLKSKD
ncbi:MAG TPA: hypothetical protein GXX30_07780 [Firmicutes bacterium]|uniref:PH domain-containing protein n=1 Tax=Candidatus Fermentithermobacillus carboniphilus TaxID=3085328 RepID=A0AAT9LCE1_9FIRM|nr:MAG: hypothetical protein IMF26_07890 [Candidatus Fermentithermobacillus carboniphilus]HHW18786.1 hypothetical protein [Candidatus Fermentithermobacillaceae bacterium]